MKSSLILAAALLVGSVACGGAPEPPKAPDTTSATPDAPKVDAPATPATPEPPKADKPADPPPVADKPADKPADTTTTTTTTTTTKKKAVVAPAKTPAKK